MLGVVRPLRPPWARLCASGVMVGPAAFDYRPLDGSENAPERFLA